MAPGKDKAKAGKVVVNNSNAKKIAKNQVDALFASKKPTQAKVDKDQAKQNGHKNVEKKDKKNAKLELDALFAGIKTKKQEKIAADDAVRRQEVKELAERKAYRKHLEDLEAEHKRTNNVSHDPRPVRYDADGLAIYSEESLRINQGGDTSECPFDCWCCF